MLGQARRLGLMPLFEPGFSRGEKRDGKDSLNSYKQRVSLLPSLSPSPPGKGPGSEETYSPGVGGTQELFQVQAMSQGMELGGDKRRDGPFSLVRL